MTINYILTTDYSPFDIRIFHKEARSLVTVGYEVTLNAHHEAAETVDGIRIINLQRQGNRKLDVILIIE